MNILQNLENLRNLYFINDKGVMFKIASINLAHDQLEFIDGSVCSFNGVGKNMKPILYSMDSIVGGVHHNGEFIKPIIKLYENAVKNIYNHIPDYKIDTIGELDGVFGLVTRDIDDNRRNGFTINTRDYFEEFDIRLTLNNELSTGDNIINKYALTQQLLSYKIALRLDEDSYIPVHTLKSDPYETPMDINHTEIKDQIKTIGT